MYTGNTMQTYTHGLMGMAIGATLWQDKPVMALACIATSVLLDLTMVPQYLLDLRAGRKLLAEQSDRLMLLKEIGHSLPLWTLVVFGASLVTIWNETLSLFMFACGAGGLLHTVVDIFTHGKGVKNRKFWDTDLKFMWPLPYDLRPYGIWEYRFDHGVLRPKWQELVVDLACLAVIIKAFI